MPATRPIWHYTTRQHLESIVRDGVIKPGRNFVPRSEIPAVWFSMNQDWEQTANKSIGSDDGTVRHGNREDTERYGGGLARIAVAPETAPHDWAAFLRLSGIAPRFAGGLEAAASADGADPSDWRVSFRPVPRGQWLAVEVWLGDGWEPLPLD